MVFRGSHTAAISSNWDRVRVRDAFTMGWFIYLPNRRWNTPRERGSSSSSPTVIRLPFKSIALCPPFLRSLHHTMRLPLLWFSNLFSLFFQYLLTRLSASWYNDHIPVCVPPPSVGCTAPVTRPRAVDEPAVPRPRFLSGPVTFFSAGLDSGGRASSNHPA